MAKYTYFWDRNLILPYWKKIRNLSPIAYWMLDEPVDTLECMDNSYYVSPGTYGTANTFGNTGIGDGHTSVYFDNTANSYVDVDVTNLASVYDGTNGSLSIWFKAGNAGVWTAATRVIAYLGTAGGSEISITTIGAAGKLFFYYGAGGGSYETDYVTTSLEWNLATITWDNGVIHTYVNGVEVIGAYTGVPTATVGALNTAVLGAGAILTGNWWGYLQHAAVFDTTLTPTQVLSLYTITAEAGIGDVAYEPWNALELQHVMGNVIGDFVFPEYGGELNATSAGTPGDLTIASGAAFAKGCLYISDEDVELTFTASVGNPRIDAVVLHKDTVAQTVRLAIREGTTQAAPPIPTYLEGDMPLFLVYLPSGFDPAADNIADTDVHDIRQFRHIGPNAYKYSTDNILPNSEFCAFSGAATGGLPPDGWSIVGVPASLLLRARPGKQPRGNGVEFSAVGTAGIECYVPIRFSQKVTGYTEAQTITVKGLFDVGSQTGTIDVSACSAGGAISGTITRTYRATYPAELQEFTIRISIASASSTPFIRIRAQATGGGVSYLGQCLVVKGYVAGNFRPIHETVMFDYALNDAAWNASAKSTGTTTIDCSASFGGVIPGYIRGIILRARCRDSGSLAGAARLYCYHRNAPAATKTLVNEVSGIANDTWREVQGFVPNDMTQATTQFKAQVVATGAGTMDVTLQPVGIVT